MQQNSRTPQIIALRDQGLNPSQIADHLQISRQAVAAALQRVDKHGQRPAGRPTGSANTGPARPPTARLAIWLDASALQMLRQQGIPWVRERLEEMARGLCK